MQNIVNYISTENIIPNAYQPRKFFNEEAIGELAQSIKVYGIIQPISVRKIGDNCYELVAGERRLRAAKSIGLKEVPAIVVEISDKDSAAIALLENLQREDLNFIEEAEAYNNLIKEHSYTQEQLADIIGKKQSTIANKIRLLKLPEDIRNNILENKLTERHARALLKVGDDKEKNKILKMVITKNLNVKATEELIDKHLFKNEKDEIAADGRKKLKSIFSPKIYINTVKQVFDKFGLDAQYSCKELENSLQIIIKIPKK